MQKFIEEVLSFGLRVVIFCVSLRVREYLSPPTIYQYRDPKGNLHNKRPRHSDFDVLNENGNCVKKRYRLSDGDVITCDAEEHFLGSKFGAQKWRDHRD